ncbi:zinc finger, CCHC-type containing protein [Tanacetum coccineum]
MGDENHIRTLEDYSKPSHESYRNIIELPVGNNVVPLRSDIILLVQNGFLFHGLRSEDPNQHLKDFLKLMDSLDLDGSITTWEDLTTRFLAQFFPPGRTAKLRNDILMFQQHHGDFLSGAWTRFKDLLQKVPHHGIDLWLQLRDLNTEESWALLKDLALYDNKIWNDPRDFAKPVKAISLPQDVLRASDIENKSFSDDDVPKEISKNSFKPYILMKKSLSTKIDPHHFNAEYDIIESLLNRGHFDSFFSLSLILFFEEFSGELAHIDLIPSGINEPTLILRKEIWSIENLLYDNSYPRLQEFNYWN